MNHYVEPATTSERFEVAIADDVLLDLRERLERTRLPNEVATEDGRFGLTSSYLNAFLDYWATSYDWRADEAAINSYPNFKVLLDDQPLHFIHQRGEGPAPIPLVLTHGWPWSFWDYRKVIGPLTDPTAYGGDATDAFDVVVPSLPGYCFSAPLRETGISARGIADLWVRLMRDALGYRGFGAAGSDWGGLVSVLLGYEHPDELIGLYVTLPNVSGALRNRFEPFTRADLGGEEAIWYEANYRRKLRDGQAFIPPNLANFRTPHTEAYAGFDSPLALSSEIAPVPHHVW